MARWSPSGVIPSQPPPGSSTDGSPMGYAMCVSSNPGGANGGHGIAATTRAREVHARGGRRVRGHCAPLALAKVGGGVAPVDRGGPLPVVDQQGCLLEEGTRVLHRAALHDDLHSARGVSDNLD